MVLIVLLNFKTPVKVVKFFNNFVFVFFHGFGDVFDLLFEAKFDLINESSLVLKNLNKLFDSFFTTSAVFNITFTVLFTAYQ
jgi:hypothetical protein